MTQKLNKYLVSSCSITQPCIWRLSFLPHSKSVLSHDGFPCISFAPIFSRVQYRWTLHQGSLGTPIGFPRAIQLWLRSPQGCLSLRNVSFIGGQIQVLRGNVGKGLFRGVLRGCFPLAALPGCGSGRPDLHSKYRAHLPHYYCDFIKDEADESILRGWLSPGKPCPLL